MNGIWKGSSPQNGAAEEAAAEGQKWCRSPVLLWLWLCSTVNKSFHAAIYLPLSL